VPCDVSVLARASELGTSLFDADSLFPGSEARAALLEALGADASADLRAPGSPGWPRPVVSFGLGLTRYNRVDGLSTGVLVDQEVGSALALHALAGVSIADRRAHGELALTR